MDGRDDATLDLVQTIIEDNIEGYTLRRETPPDPPEASRALPDRLSPSLEDMRAHFAKYLKPDDDDDATTTSERDVQTGEDIHFYVAVPSDPRYESVGPRTVVISLSQLKILSIQG